MKKLALSFLISTGAISAHAETNISADLLIGTADHKTKVGSSSESGDDISIGVRGAYNINENFAVEVAFQDYGETDETYIDSFGDTINDKASATALTAGVKGSIPLSASFSLNGRLGVSSWDFEFRGTDSSFPGVEFSFDDDGTDLYYGVGMQLMLNEAFSVGAEYTITEMGLSVEGGSADHEVKNLAIFASYSF